MLLALISSQYLGFIAGLFTSVSLLPQLIKIIKEKKVDDISIPMLLMLMTGVSLWMWYGIMKDDLPIIYTNAFSLSLDLSILVLRFKYSRSAPKH